MNNRSHIVEDSQLESSDSKTTDELDFGLQEYISDLLIEPVEEKNILQITQKEKNTSITSMQKKDSSECSDRTGTNPSRHRTRMQEGKTISHKSNDRLESLNHKKLTKNTKDIQIKGFLDPDPRLEKVSKLLEKIATLPLKQDLTTTENIGKPKKEVRINEKRPAKVVTRKEEEALIQITNENSFVEREKQPLRNFLDDNFQTLIFDVNNLPLAVPLIKLGGIVNISNQEITPLVGTPEWFLGLIPNERGNLMVVDTQKFLMPERTIKDDRNYDYLIVLDNSQWALACHNVGDAKSINASDVRWSNQSSKRQWFAGMVVEYMSALLEVDSLINLLAEQIVD